MHTQTTTQPVQLAPLPGVQMKTVADTCRIKVNVTGFYADDIRVVANDNMLIVELSSKPQALKNYYLGEYLPKHHIRTIPLDFSVDAKSVMTHYNNGKLEILVRKTDKAQDESELETDARAEECAA